MLDTKYLTLLLESLRSRDIPFNQRDLQEALGTQGHPSMQTWIDEHLGPDTLITKEELLLYSALQNSHEIDAFTSLQDPSILRGVRDCDICDAIEQLQKSTAAIEKHTETLKKQQAAVATLVKENRQHHAASVEAGDSQYRAWMTQNNHSRSAADGLLQSLKYQTAELTAQCKAADVELRKTASEMLRLDDKLLSRVQKLASDLDPGYELEEGTANRIRDLCARLIKYTVEAVHARLDRIYLEATNGRGNALKGIEALDNAEITALLDELESLYTEILPVAQMSAEQQYLEPALRLIASHVVQGEERSSKAIESISQCLLDLTDKLQEFTAHTVEYNNCRMVIMLMASTVKAELDAGRPPSPKPKPSCPTRIRKQSKPISPVRARNTRRRSSATSVDDDSNPELQILRNLGISSPLESNGERNIVTTFQDLLADRMMKLNGHMKSLEEVSEASIGSHLHDSQVTLQLLMNSVLSETRYRSVSLVDAEIQAAIGELEQGVEAIKRDIATVNLDPLREKNVRRDDFVERWIR